MSGKLAKVEGGHRKGSATERWNTRSEMKALTRRARRLAGKAAIVDEISSEEVKRYFEGDPLPRNWKQWPCATCSAAGRY